MDGCNEVNSSYHICIVMGLLGIEFLRDLKLDVKGKRDQKCVKFSRILWKKNSETSIRFLDQTFTYSNQECKWI